MRGYDPTEEFGINEEEYQEIIESVNNYFDQPERTLQDIEYDMYPDGDASNEETEYLEILNNPDFEVIYELHDWEYVRDFNVTVSEDGKNHFWLLRSRK